MTEQKLSKSQRQALEAIRDNRTLLITYAIGWRSEVSFLDTEDDADFGERQIDSFRQRGLVELEPNSANEPGGFAFHYFVRLTDAGLKALEVSR